MLLKLRTSGAKHAGQKKTKLKSLRKTKHSKMSLVQPTNIVVETIEEQEQEQEQMQEEHQEEEEEHHAIEEQEGVVFLCKEDINELKEVLTVIGFRNYLEDPVLGLCKTTDMVTFSLLSIARFLLWTHLCLKKVPLELSTDAVLRWSKILISKKATVVQQFQAFLVEALKFSPDSIIHFVSRLKEYVEWFRMFRSERSLDPFKIKQSKYDKFMTICSRIMKGARQLRRKRLKMKSGSQTNAMDEAIANRQLPQGGLKELQDTVAAEMQWIYAFCTSVRRGPGLVDEPTYQQLMCLLIASMYVFAPQGRISGIQDLKVKDAPELMESFATSKEFKTSSTYGMQAVTMSDISKEILSIYLKFFRPRVTNARPCPNDPLFLTYQGTPDKRLGRHVTAFFAPRLGINITTTLIRALVETTVEDKYRSGEITLDQREAMSAISGHSSKIVKDHYLRLNVADQLEKAKIAMGMSDAVSTPTTVPKALVKLKDWGTAHPQYECTNHNARIKFSAEEDAYLLDLAQDMMRIDGSLPDRFTSLALKAIKADPDATAIFHLRHVFSADRLRARLRHHKLIL